MHAFWVHGALLIEMEDNRIATWAMMDYFLSLSFFIPQFFPQ
ncbi:hypothetical protein [Halobacillus mangrovi]